MPGCPNPTEGRCGVGTGLEQTPVAELNCSYNLPAAQQKRSSAVAGVALDVLKVKIPILFHWSSPINQNEAEFSLQGLGSIHLCPHVEENQLPQDNSLQKPLEMAPQQDFHWQSTILARPVASEQFHLPQ